MSLAVNNDFINAKSTLNNAQRLGAVDALLTLESLARAVESDQELLYFIANESRRVLPYRQAVAFTRHKKGLSVAAVSSLSVVDRSSAFILDMQDIVGQLQSESNLSSAAEFSVMAYTNQSTTGKVQYPFDHALWIPFEHRNKGVIGGVILLKEKPWLEQEMIIANRMQEFYSYTLYALLAIKPLSIKDRLVNNRFAFSLVVLSFLALFIPVSMTSLAPMEIVALDPEVVNAPISGVVDEISVQQNSIVKKGDIIIKLNDIEQMHQVNTASQAVNIAMAKLKRVKQSVLQTSDEKQSLAILQEELYAAQIDLKYAKEQLELVNIRASSDGVVIYEDRNEWIGKPVSVGENILRIADPTKVQFRINVPVKDSIALEKNAPVKAYLDADPLHPLDGVIASASYHASAMANQELAYKVEASIANNTESNLRIGMRGTAKIYGEQVSLFFYLFRRPLSWFRQFVGF